MKSSHFEWSYPTIINLLTNVIDEAFTELIQITLTPKMTTALLVETSVTVNNSPIQDYVHPDDHTEPTYETTPAFKPFTLFYML